MRIAGSGRKRVNWLLVMAGGATGAALRYGVGLLALRRLGPGFPWGTLGVNLAGGFAMGLLVGGLVRVGGNEALRVLLGVGVLGGFTTFSAFGLECWTMLARGEWLTAALYAGGSVAGAVALTGLGVAALR